LRSLKIQDQHDNGIIQLENNKNGPQNETLESIMGKKDQDDKPKNTAPVDGYWLTLQDWSQCSKKCDGGISTFHRMCVPPKNGGRACQGEAIITKKCNMDPCPDVGEDGENGGKKGKTTVNDPIVKVIPFSSAPQRFRLCKIKESDMMIYEDGKDPNKKNDPLLKGKKISEIGGIRLPCRVIMNPQTLTIFTGQKFDTLYYTFNLKASRFFDIEKKNCFKIYENGKKYVTLCPYGSEVNGSEYDEWRKDFDDFKNRCDRPEKGLSAAEQKALDDKIKDKMVLIFFKASFV